MTAAPRKNVPASAPKPQDHQAKKPAAARKAEANGFAIVEQCGVNLSIPVGDAMPLDALLLLQGDAETLRDYGIDGDAKDAKDAKTNLVVTKLLLGPEQWAEFRAQRPTLADFNAIGEKLEALLGN